MSGITYSVDAIEQFQVVTSGGQAELGRALGGYVNVVTKSGTNVLRGSAYEYRVSYTLAKAMNNLGEFFFSSPIDPFDLAKDLGPIRQRSPSSSGGEWRGAGAAWHRCQRHGASLLAPPLNVTSGVTTIQATAGRPIVNGAFIARNGEAGDPFFTLNLRVGRTFRIAERITLEGVVDAFNVTNRVNVLMRNANFGAGAYPASPSPTFRDVTSVGEARSLQIGLRVQL